MSYSENEEVLVCLVDETLDILGKMPYYYVNENNCVHCLDAYVYRSVKYGHQTVKIYIQFKAVDGAKTTPIFYAKRLIFA